MAKGVEMEDGLLAAQDTRGAGEGGKPIKAHITQTSHPHHRNLDILLKERHNKF